jgi:hypothetical protein
MREWPLAVLAGAIALTACSDQPKREVMAVVVDIRPHISPKWHTDEWVVEARTWDGLRGTKSVLRDRLNCRVGDAIPVTAQGVSLTLDDHACERAGAPPAHSLPL